MGFLDLAQKSFSLNFTMWYGSDLLASLILQFFLPMLFLLLLMLFLLLLSFLSCASKDVDSNLTDAQLNVFVSSKKMSRLMMRCVSFHLKKLDDEVDVLDDDGKCRRREC